MLAVAVGDVEVRLSSKKYLQDKDLRLTRYVYMTSLIIVLQQCFFKYLHLSMICECQYVYYHEIYHLNIRILHFEY